MLWGSEILATRDSDCSVLVAVVASSILRGRFDDLQAARRVATWLWSWMDSSFNKMSVEVT